MGTDTDAQSITINYEGGSMTLPIGNAKSLFGADYDDLVGETLQISIPVASHSRTRIIGEPSSSVAAHNRNYTLWPTSQANNAASGKAVYMAWEGSDGSWTVRVTGAMAALGDFLLKSSPKIVTFRTTRGTKYGPFIKESSI
tara:strand:- start:842 stop:1267 length:426 start_codon:yes stop_codon:yes gene_type:complete